MSACGSTETGTLPPIKTSGSIGNTYRTRQAGDEPRETVNQVNGNLRASSYIWQPWFVTAQAGVDFAQESSESGNVRGDDVILAGDAAIGLLPLSHFPTEVAVSRVDSRVKGNVGSDFTRDRASVVQRSLFENNLRILTTLSYDTVDQPDAGEEEIRSAGLVVTKALESSQISLDLRHRDSEFLAIVPEEQDHAEDVNAATLSHNYTPSSTFRMHSTLNYIEDSDDTEIQTQDHLTVQGITTQQWRSGKHPFTINSALRASRDRSEFDGSASETSDTRNTLASGAIGINYPIKPRLTANIGLNGLYQDVRRISDEVVVPTDPPSERTLESSLLGSVTYISVSRPVGGFMWRWNTDANAQGRYRDVRTRDTGSERLDGSGGGNWGHSATRPMPVPFLGPGQFSASQSAGVTLSSDDPEDDFLVPSLAHDATVTYRATRQGSATFFRFSVGDRHEFLAEDASQSQLATLQVNRQSFVDVRRNWTAALTVQATRRKVRNQEADFVASATGRLAYIDQRLFDVRDLKFSSILELNAIGLEDVIRNETEENRFERERRADWTNRIEYRIGKITTSLEGSVFYVGKEYGNAVFFRVRRDFDGVF